jgi:hypothetical protein
VGGHGDVRAQAAAALLHGVRVELANLGKLTISSPPYLDSILLKFVPVQKRRR